MELKQKEKNNGSNLHQPDVDTHTLSRRHKVQLLLNSKRWLTTDQSSSAKKNVSNQKGTKCLVTLWILSHCEFCVEVLSAIMLSSACCFRHVLTKLIYSNFKSSSAISLFFCKCYRLQFKLCIVWGFAFSMTTDVDTDADLSKDQMKWAEAQT